MCRVMAVFNMAKKDRYFIKNMMKELEKVQGGHGNGIYNFKTSYYNHSFNTDHLLDLSFYNFMFHTRVCTAGEVSLDNSHPYYLKNIMIMQNGSATYYLPRNANRKKGFSDTYHLGKCISEENMNSNSDIYDMNWYGILFLYFLKEKVFKIYVKKEFYLLVSNRNSILFASQETKSSKKYCKYVQKLPEGTYTITFNPLNITFEEKKETNTYYYSGYGSGYASGSHWDYKTKSWVTAKKEVELPIGIINITKKEEEEEEKEEEEKPIIKKKKTGTKKNGKTHTTTISVKKKERSIIDGLPIYTENDFNNCVISGSLYMPDIDNVLFDYCKVVHRWMIGQWVRKDINKYLDDIMADNMIFACSYKTCKYQCELFDEWLSRNSDDDTEVFIDILDNIKGGKLL